MPAPADMSMHRFARHLGEETYLPGSDADLYVPCRLWTGAVTSEGYGLFRAGPGRLVSAHVWAFQRAFGDIPDGWMVDHWCHDPDLCPGGRADLHRRCVTLDHLRLVTAGENTRRGNSAAGINSRKTHCIRGHPLSGDNLYVHPRRGTRHCRACQQQRNREAMARARAAAAGVAALRASAGPRVTQETLAV